ncbi:MAG: hypothetical protein ABIL09_25495 [Gemmatimonadota bacterium]
MSMEVWMRIGQPLEPVMAEYERIFDAWEAGGVRALVFGRLLFQDSTGASVVPAFRGQTTPYQRRGIQVQEGAIPTDPAKERQLHAMLANACDRGWQVFIFCPGQGTTRVTAPPPAADPYGALLQAAVWEDVFGAFPEAHGGIVDGWTESPYELIYHHGNAVFAPLTEAAQRTAELRGHDPARLERGRRHLESRFRHLTPAMVRYYGHHGVLAGLNLFDVDEDSLYWLRWRREDGLAQGRAFRRELDQLPRRLLLGNGLRSAVFSGMTAFDYLAWDGILDLLLVKHYFWHRGFDGLYGTVARWVRQVGEWNPSLSEADCFAVARAWLGVELPEVGGLADMELGFPPAFFAQVVAAETARALAAASDPRKVVPWVDTGRMPHGGDPMTAGDLHRILTSSAAAGLQRFLFHNHAHLTTAEWKVISRLCGTEWVEDPRGAYWPPATPKPETYG